MTPDPPITVLVPVYRGADDVRRCLASVLRHGSSRPAELLAIDDASPEAEVSAELERFASRQGEMPIRVLRNPENLGFAATVNRGLRASSGDVVVLNADTVVTEGWLDRLAEAAEEPDVATVTPLTNFGSICTLPRAMIDRFDLDGADPRIDECAAFVLSHSLHVRPEVITGVGFCLYLTQGAIDRCGLLDDETFGSGYGEEVDFCLRAGRLGFRHLVEDATFVYHRGGGSFGDERDPGLARSSAVLHERYPFFKAANTRERRRDPLAVPFAALELSLAPRQSDRPHVLHLLHNDPEALGGTESHVRALLRTLSDEFDFSQLYPVDSGFVLRSTWKDGDGADRVEELLLPGAQRRVTRLHDESAAAALATTLELHTFDAIHLQNLIGHSLAPLDVLANFAGSVVCSVRDLYLACPHHWLLYQNREACGIPDDLSFCARCLPETQRTSLEHLEELRSTVTKRLGTVDHWVFASRSAADYFLRVYDLPEERLDVIPHSATIPRDEALRVVDERSILDEPLRLAFVGLGWAKKGLHVVNHLAEQLVGRPVEVHHFGLLREEASPALHLHGPYENRMLPRLLHQSGMHVILLPGPYAETFGHVMTEALLSGLPVVGAAYGALGERLRAQGAGWTIDPDDPDELIELVEHLDGCRLELLRASRAAARAPVASPAENAAQYASLYRNAAGARPQGDDQP